jgi:hypothetical protein
MLNIGSTHHNSPPTPRYSRVATTLDHAADQSNHPPTGKHPAMTNNQLTNVQPLTFKNDATKEFYSRLSEQTPNFSTRQLMLAIAF